MARRAARRAPATPSPEPDDASAAGLAHVAAVSFLAARAAPWGGFWITLAGGVALARAGERLGARGGYGASIAATLQSVAMIGPARLGVPLTQALSAPMLGRLNARGSGALAQVLACALVRTAQNVLGTVFFIGIVTGLDAYAASYDEVIAMLSSLPVVGPILALPTGVTAALVATGAALLAWSAFGSTVQVLVYRRGLSRWRSGAAEADVEAGSAPRPDEPLRGPQTDAAPGSRLDPRAVTIAAAIVFCLLLTSTSWALIGAVAVWLGLASVAAGRLDRDALPAGLVLALVLAASGFGFSLVGGLGLDIALRRGARAGLLVLVATWLRAAAGSDGLREVARRGLHRLRAVPSLAEAARALDEIGAAPRLAAAGRALFGSLGRVRKRPLPVVDGVLAWVRLETRRFRPAAAAVRAGVAFRARDALLIGSVALPAAGLLAL